MIISICISTRRRPEGLRKLLFSITSIIIPKGDIQLQIIVVENDTIMHVETIIEEFKQTSTIPIYYFLESKSGVCHARNRTVKESEGADYCVFVDDDQIVDKNWLVELINCQSEYNSDGVYGINPPIFNFPTKEHVIKFHTPKPMNYGTKLIAAPTNCLLIKKSLLDNVPGPFDNRLNSLGGEDILLTQKITRNGGIIISNPKAIAYELIDKDRSTLSYIIKRSYRNGNTFIVVSLILEEDKIIKFKMFVNLLVRLIFGIIITTPLWIFSKQKKYDGVIRIAFNLGGILGLTGKKTKFYQ